MREKNVSSERESTAALVSRCAFSTNKQTFRTYQKSPGTPNEWHLVQSPLSNSPPAPEHVSICPGSAVPIRTAKIHMTFRKKLLERMLEASRVLGNMVLFKCNVCHSRFPTFHPAYFPPPAIAKDMELLRHRKDCVAACSVEVSSRP